MFRVADTSSSSYPSLEPDPERLNLDLDKSSPQKQSRRPPGKENAKPQSPLKSTKSILRQGQDAGPSSGAGPSSSKVGPSSSKVGPSTRSPRRQRDHSSSSEEEFVIPASRAKPPHKQTPARKQGQRSPQRQEQRSPQRVNPSFSKRPTKLNPNPVGAPRRKQMTPALRAINHLQHTTTPLIPRASFCRVVRELIQENDRGEHYRITAPAIEALREMAESYVTNALGDAYRITLNRKQATLQPKDVHLLMYLRGPNETSRN
jgi:histone H3/H4